MEMLSFGGRPWPTSAFVWAAWGQTQ